MQPTSTIPMVARIALSFACYRELHSSDMNPEKALVEAEAFMAAMSLIADQMRGKLHGMDYLVHFAFRKVTPQRIQNRLGVLKRSLTDTMVQAQKDFTDGKLSPDDHDYVLELIEALALDASEAKEIEA